MFVESMILERYKRTRDFAFTSFASANMNKLSFRKMKSNESFSVDKFSNTKWLFDCVISVLEQALSSCKNKLSSYRRW